MDALMSTVADGRIVLVMLAFVVLEVLVLVALWKKRSIGIAPFPLIVNVLAGTCLMLALRASLVEAGTKVIAFWLVASLVAHVADLSVRWQRAGSSHVGDSHGG